MASPTTPRDGFTVPSANRAEHVYRIAWRDLSLTLSERKILNAVNLEIAPGEKVALVGPSGAGKTTLLRIASGLVEAHTGAYCVDGEPLLGQSSKAQRSYRARLMYLPQLAPLIPNLAVVHNVLWGSVASWSRWQALRSLFVPRQTQEVQAALARVGLGDRMWDLPESLSGGEQQRVAVARLMVACPSLLLADEPAASLDVAHSCDVVGMMLEASDSCGTTVVLSLHDLALLKCGFDRIIAMREGQVHWQGTPSQWTPEIQAQIFTQSRAAERLSEPSKA